MKFIGSDGTLPALHWPFIRSFGTRLVGQQSTRVLLWVECRNARYTTGFELGASRPLPLDLSYIRRFRVRKHLCNNGAPAPGLLALHTKLQAW